MTRSLIPVIAALLVFVAVYDGQAQSARTEVLHLKDGRVLTGPLRVEKERVVITRKIGAGQVTERYPFSRVEPHTLYGLVVASLQPLNAADHRRIADLAFDTKLFATAARHYRHAATDKENVPTELMTRIELSEKKDVEHILTEARADLGREDFRRARRRTLSALRRYGERPEVSLITAQLDQISKKSAAAKRRREALARTEAARKTWERHARQLAGVEKELGKAQQLESRALSAGGGLRQSKRRYDLAIRYLDRADRSLAKLRKVRGLANELVDRAGRAEDTLVTMHIRLRLHLASLYSVRGSYGSAIGYTNQALAYDPTDQGALDARSKIEQAAAAASAARIIR